MLKCTGYVKIYIITPPLVTKILKAMFKWKKIRKATKGGLLE